MPPKKATTAASKQKANTSAKVTKPAATDAAKAPTRGRGRPKKEETASETKTPAANKGKAATTTTTTKKTAPKTAAKSKKEESAAVKAEVKPKATASRKRKAGSETPAAPAKKAKVLVKGPVINDPPTEKLDVFVFGEGTAGELGLGTAKIAVDVKRPRLNKLLAPYGIVQVAAGGMHVVAITDDNKVLTWGVNDQGALGRNTEWDGGLKDMDDDKSDADSDASEDDNGLNPKESTPGEVDWSQTELAEGTRFVQVTAGDSSTFALTDDGKVYGWGVFRSNDGPFGFTPEVKEARRPVLIQGLKKVKAIAAGANHVLALADNGAVFAWGSGQQNQLGRRVVERTKVEGLKPREFGLPKGATKGIKAIETGSYHSFAISKTGAVYAWGLNNFGETGIAEGAGQDDAVILKPQVVKSLEGKDIASIKGGGHHSVAVTASGNCLVWGRIDGNQTGLTPDTIQALPEDAVIRDEQNRLRIITIPQKVSAIQGAVKTATASGDNNIAITKDGKAWSWGFSANYQTGQGTMDDVVVATMIDNTAVRERKLNGAMCGGQFSMLTALAEGA